MNVTKNDLSFNSIKLDYQAMLKTAIVAYSHTRNELERLVHETHDIKPRLSLAFNARLIADEARQLEVVAETMHTLEEGLSREELEVVNKPKVKGE